MGGRGARSGISDYGNVYDVVLGKVFEEMSDCLDYADNDDKWKDSLDTCYKLLNLPLFDGKSFREIIDDVEFEY